MTHPRFITAPRIAASLGALLATLATPAFAAAPVPAESPAVSAGVDHSQAYGEVSWLTRMFFPTRGTAISTEIDAVMFFIFWVSVFFFVLLMGLTVYFAVRYRRRPGVPQQRSAAHNTPLEITWSVIPTLLMAVMFVWGFRLYLDMHAVPANAETVHVTALKWAWQFEYDDGSTSRELTDPIVGVQYPVIAVPQNTPVRFLMQSKDVIHSLYIPAFRKKIDVFPNRYTVYSFTAKEPGDYQLFCTEYCGDFHSQMMALIRVLPPAQYVAWRAEQASTDDIPLNELGKTLRLTKGCAQCHTVDGTALAGPTWLNSYGTTRQFTDGTSATVDENYIRESILYPHVKIAAGYSNQMPSYAGQFKEREIRAIVAYMAELSAQGQGDLEQMMEEDDAAREEAAEGEPQAMAAPSAPSVPE